VARNTVSVSRCGPKTWSTHTLNGGGAAFSPPCEPRASASALRMDNVLFSSSTTHALTPPFACTTDEEFPLNQVRQRKVGAVPPPARARSAVSNLYERPMSPDESGSVPCRKG
jgi:hypothetical protein